MKTKKCFNVEIGAEHTLTDMVIRAWLELVSRFLSACWALYTAVYDLTKSFDNTFHFSGRWDRSDRSYPYLMILIFQDGYTLDRYDLYDLARQAAR